MRIGVFLGEFTPEAGGGYTFVNDIAEAFFTIAGESDHQYSVFCPPAAAAVLNARGLPANVRAVALKPRCLLGKAIMALKHLLPAFSMAWRFPSALERAATREQIDMLWFVGGFFDTPDMPYIATVWDVQHRTHPWFPEVSAKGRWDYREHFISRHLKRATRVITGTQAGKNELAFFYQIPESRVCLLPHPTPNFVLVAQKNTADIHKKFGLKEKFLLYPAQFWAHKNHVNLLHALTILKQRGAAVPDIALVGSDKGNKAYVLQVAAELGVAQHVHALGFVSTEELIGLYQAAGAMIYPSFSGPENLPPLEALALSCPVANADFPGAREQLGDAAIYFDPHSPQSIADAIIHVLQPAPQLIEKGLERARRWTGEQFVRGVFALMDDCAHERRCWK